MAKINFTSNNSVKKAANNYKTLFFKSVALTSDSTKNWVISIVQNNLTGDVALSARQFVESAKYSGPTKNGFYQVISSAEDFALLEESFSELFAHFRQMMTED